jgi:membrane peptidoglycan carboxypeptidase
VSGNRATPAPRKKATAGSGAAQGRPGSTSARGAAGAANGGSGGAGKGPGRKGSKPSGEPKSVGARVRTALKWVLVVGLVCLLILAGIGFFAYKNTTIPDANKAFEAQSSFVYYNGGKAKIGRFADQNRESIPLADIPHSMQDAAIAAEDRTFYTNSGIDPKGIVRAAFSNAKGNATQGASTITQQYVKILYLSQERTLSRKVKEAFLSLKVQQEQSKSAILEGYLNTIYFGRGAYGVQAASNAYFDKPAKKLTVPESAMLAAVLNSPNYLSPDRGAEGRQALVERYDYVLRGMVTMGNLEASEADNYYGQLPKLGKPSANNMYGGQRGFMLTMVKDELRRLGFDDAEIDAGGLRVETTFTRKAMKAAEDGVAQERPDGLKKLHVATASVDVKTGALLGFYAGQDYLDSQLNWARLGGSPGSAFKPFALAAALEAGFSLKDTFDGNSPYEFEGGAEVVNEGPGDGNDYGSAISLTQATEESVNTAYSDLTESLPDGPRDILKMAVAMGVPRNSPGLEANNAIALGSATISPIVMANAYATIANGGVHHDWFTVKKVTRASDGTVLWRAPRKTDRVISEDLASDVSYALQQVVQNGTGQNAQALGRPAAGKTGTATNEDGDVSSSWFVGYTPQVSTAVMYVRGKGNEALNGFLPSYFGANFPTYTWRAVMQAVLDGTEVEDFPPPANLDGEAPDDGHAPYTPPPPPPEKPEKKSKPKPTPEAPQTQAPNTPAPNPPDPAPSQGGGGGDGGNGGGGGGGTDCEPTDPTCTP